MASVLYLLLCWGYIAQLVSADRFLVTAPSVFHVGVKERVSVQVGKSLLNKPVTCYLENETGRVRIMSNEDTVRISQEGQIGILELEVNKEKAADLPSANAEPPYLNLMCNVGERKRQSARVLVSQHRGYIFIQTDQPMYNPTQRVQYRIFILDHAMRPTSVSDIYVYIINPEGNTVKKSSFRSKGGIFSHSFHIPDVSQPGVWKIKAHYKNDEKNPSVREFKVQKFVLPSFGVSIKPDDSYLLVITDNFTFTISASYSFGKTISGGYHCRFGVRKDDAVETNIKFIKGLEMTGAIKDGKAMLTVKISDIREKFKSSNQEEFPEMEARLYIAATVTDTKSGEVQETEILLPIVKHRYTVDLSRTRSHYIPKMPFNVIAEVKTPNGQPATNIQVKIEVSSSDKKSITTRTNDDGIAISTFNLVQTPDVLSVEVAIDEFKSQKEVPRATSSTNSFLQISMDYKILSTGANLIVSFNVVNGRPEDGHIYYMTVSKGTLRYADSLLSGELTKANIIIRPDMTPSFRLIAYYYNTNGEIIADSVWVDVKDVCEGKIEVKPQDVKNYYLPAAKVHLDIDVGTQTNAKVALLAVDKAIYGLNAQNKLTLNQVFSSMQSYDLGCSFGGGKNTASVLNNAGLAFISNSQTVISEMRIGFSCESGFRRQKRSINMQEEMKKKEQEYAKEALRKCCRYGMTLIPMKLTCEERKKRVSQAESQECVEAFMKCCEFSVQLRKKKWQEEMKNTHGRTASASKTEDFFDNEVQYIRQSFPPSFAFSDFSVTGKSKHIIIVPDSITTWEIQAASLSPSHGFCVAEPIDIKVFQPLFMSLRLPYSVKRNEQLAIVVVIYNYGKDTRELVVHMKQVEGLCSPGAASTASSIDISILPESSMTVTFSAVPLIDGEIPITIQLYDRDFGMGVDAIQKTLLVMSEGFRMQVEESHIINLDGRSDKWIFIDGTFPNSTIPGSPTNMFATIEGETFGPATAVPLLSPSKVEKLIRAPSGCAEQTMILMSPTALSIRYLDSTNRWLDLRAGTRDSALEVIQKSYERILTYKKRDGSYGAWLTHPTSNWLTALVVKVLSLVADLGLAVVEDQELISQQDIRHSVSYLIQQQKEDGSFDDPNPVIHREMQGGIGGIEQDASLTAFIAIALKHSLPFLDRETKDAESSITRATQYLLTRVDELQRPFAMAITTYCLSICLEDPKQAKSAWTKLKSLGKTEGDCKGWRADEGLRLTAEKKQYLVPPTVALTVETTAYTLLSAVAQGDFEEAKKAACFLSSQENYDGGFKSTQDTIVALEALSTHSLRKPVTPQSNFVVQFKTPGRSGKETVTFDKNSGKVEAELKRLLGGSINAEISGKGEAKIKVVKAFFAMDPYVNCDHLSINVTVTGKVQYTAEFKENYEYYDYGDESDNRREEEDFPRSAIEWFDARTRRRRDTVESIKEGDQLTYEVCVGHSLEQNTSGMAIADITLLSGFEPVTEDLDKLKDLADKYISHYEISQGRVLLYFNEILGGRECVNFEAKQTVPIGLLQPAPATFYDYYEPDRRCTVFYAAPKRSKKVSVLCSGDVCQCAERGCSQQKKSLESDIRKEDRFRHACFQPVVDYGFVVTVVSVEEASNFVLYITKVEEILKFNRDLSVDINSTRVFAKRKHCKDQLEKGQMYLIMGNDGTTKDKHGVMQYLLDSDTWIEWKPPIEKCRATINRPACKELKTFLREYQINGCNQ